MSVYPPAIIAAVKCLGLAYGEYPACAPATGKWPLEWDPSDGSPVPGPIDCSGFARWVLAKAGVTLPDGSYNQISVCDKLPAAQQQNPPALALGFFQSPGSPQVDHVVISTGTGVVVEARGDKYQAVIVRPVDVWLAQAGFLGFYAPPGLGL